LPWIVLAMILHIALLNPAAPPPSHLPDRAPSSAAALDPSARPARSAAALERLLSPDVDLSAIEDPRALAELGHLALARSLPDRASAAFTLSLAREEINNYEKSFTSSPFAAAILAERLGDLPRARDLWRATFSLDVLKAYFFIAQFSQDPDRDALLAEARRFIEAAAQSARAGGSPLIYTTSKGEPRALQLVSLADAKAAFAAGQQLRYAFIEDLDLSGESFEGQVSCMRCVVGSLSAPGATFSDRLHFTGVVLGDLHLGRKKEGDVVRADAATINTLFLDNTLVFGDLNLDSVQIPGRVANLPMMVIEGAADLRNIHIFNTIDMRYVWIRGDLNLKEADFGGAGYFGNLRAGGMHLIRAITSRQPLLFNSSHFAGPVIIERSDLQRGASFEDATFDADMRLSHCRFYDRLNLSRVQFLGRATLTRLELTDLDVFGVRVHGDADFSDTVVTGSARFSVDALARRQHLADPAPLHRLYKQYQGDVDADRDLTKGSQYGVLHVDDLSASFRRDVSFTNTIFQKFVSFEGVHFGNPLDQDASDARQTANFHNTQFFGEAHFEDTTFFADADFRTIFGNEISFNRANFYGDWMLDDANVPGRVSLSDARLQADATLSMYGSRIASLGVAQAQLIDDANGSRLFYQRCAEAQTLTPELLSDPRLDDAYWDSLREVEITDEADIERRARQLCAARVVGEFVVLRDSFNKRGMTQESDWSYWNMRHHTNRRLRLLSDSAWDSMKGWGEWLLFEQGFGWGVRLGNLAWTSLAVILFFAGLLRLTCGGVYVNWDDQKILMRDLPLWTFFLMSFHTFLGRPRDWRAQVSSTTWKILYVTEISAGIIITTFFIGAYTRMVLR
jgi:hypothetical protein